MKLYFAGAEVKGWRDLLARETVSDVALSYVGLQRRLKGAAKWDISDHFPAETRVFLDSGAYTLNREESGYTREEAQELSVRYMDFVTSNSGAASLISEFDAQVLGQDYIQAMRDDFYSGIDPDKFMPIWHSESGREALESLCSQYSVVGIRQADATDITLVPVLNSLVGRYGVRLHGVAITSKDAMRDVRWDSVSSTSWLSPSMYGDTIVWIEREKDLKRFPKDYKSSRKQHRTMFTDLGFDAEKIENDDSGELLRLSIWSWKQFVDHINADGVTTAGRNEKYQNPETGNAEVANLGEESGTERLPAITKRRDTVLIPTIGLLKQTTSEEDEEGNRRDRTETFTIIRSESMRACNTCFLRSKCVAFEPGANCAYNMPIEIRTTDQLKALQAALVEMQTQRVLFMKLAEDVEGGYADPNLSSEMDRLQRMIKAKSDSEREGFSLKIEASGSNGNAGYFSRMFGSGAGEKLAILEQPVKADDLIKDSEIGEIVEAEIVG